MAQIVMNHPPKLRGDDPPLFSTQQQQLQQQQTGVSVAAQDPLFEALAKYITAGAGPSSITHSEIEDIINAHSTQDSRAFLESVVQPIQEPRIRVWKNQAQADGFVSTNMESLTLKFSATRNLIFQKLDFRGNSPGFFPPQVFLFEDKARFYWDDLADNMSVRTEMNWLTNLHILTVTFFDGSNNSIAELLVKDATLRLPPHTINGTGVFKFPQGPQ